MEGRSLIKNGEMLTTLKNSLDHQFQMLHQFKFTFKLVKLSNKMTQSIQKMSLIPNAILIYDSICPNKTYSPFFTYSFL